MPKSKHQIPGRVRSAYEFFKAHRDQCSVQMMCRVLEVAPSGYYEWVLQPVSNRAQEDAPLLRLIRASFIASHGIYGAPRVFLDLREAGETCSKHRVARAGAPSQFTGASRISHPALGRGQAVGLDPESPQATVHRHQAQCRLGNGHYLQPHVARMALPGRRHGFVLAPDRRLGRSTHHSSRARAQCGADGCASTTATRHADSFRSGNPVRSLANGQMRPRSNV